MNECTLPPEGWMCTRIEGHDGPCAAMQRHRFVPPVSIENGEQLRLSGNKYEVWAKIREGEIVNE